MASTSVGASTSKPPGVEIVHDSDWSGGGRSFYFKDPAGNLVEIADRDFWPQPA